MRITKKNQAIIRKVAEGYYLRTSAISLGKAYYQDGFYSYTDSHRIFADQVPYEGYTVKDGSEVPVIGRYWDQVNNTTLSPVWIDVAKLKRWCKVQPRKKDIRPYIIDTDEGYIGVNPKYLLEQIEFTSTNCIWIDSQEIKTDTEYLSGWEGIVEYNYYAGPIYSFKESRKVITFPIRIGYPRAVHQTTLSKVA